MTIHFPSLAKANMLLGFLGCLLCSVPQLFTHTLPPRVSLALWGVLLSHVADLGPRVLSHLTLPSLHHAN